MSIKAFCYIAIFGIVGAIFGGVAYQNAWFEKTVSPQGQLDASTSVDNPADQRNIEGDTFVTNNSNQDTMVSGPSASSAPAKPLSGVFDYDENEAISNLAHDINSWQLPESQTSLFSPEPFDIETYRADPEAYLRQVRPGRIFQTAQPGVGVKRLAARSRGLHRLVRGETTLLEVMAEPGMPVTFHTQQVGEFDNRLSTISVKADESGVARVHFKATSTSGLVNVVAASPVHSEQVEFAVRVSAPEVVIN
jgi:hypothetical protein